MGLDLAAVRFNLFLQAKRCQFGRMATLGRLQMNLTVDELLSAASRRSLSLDASKANALLTEAGGYAEPFYRWLGATNIESFDASRYENATHLWDMNESLVDEYHEKFDFVFDGGTLEHVFYAPSALREAMLLPRRGGWYAGVTVANSLMGHGFYQFGSDMIFAAFSRENGYRLLGVYLVEDKQNAVFHEVAAPSPERGRALLASMWPILLLYVAERIEDVPAKLKATQLDYAEAWSSGVHVERIGGSNSFIKRSLSRLPPGARNHILRRLKMVYLALTGQTFINRKCFIPRPEI